MQETTEAQIHTSTLPDGGEILLCFRHREQRYAEFQLGIVVKDANGFVAAFDAPLEPEVMDMIEAGDMRIRNRIAKAVFSHLPASSSRPAAEGISVRGMPPIVFTSPVDIAKRIYPLPPSVDAIEWRMNNQTAHDDDSASWIRSNPGMLGMRAPSTIVHLSTATDLENRTHRDCLRNAILEYPVLWKTEDVVKALIDMLATGELPGNKPIGLRDMATAASRAYGFDVTPKGMSAALRMGWDSIRGEQGVRTFLGVVSLLPASWIPTEPDEQMDLLHLVGDIDFILGRNQDPKWTAKLLGHSAGRWSELLASFDPAPTPGIELGGTLRARNALKDIADYLDWLAEELVAPFVEVGHPATNKGALRLIATMIAMDGGGIRSLFGKSRTWHDTRPTPSTRLMHADGDWESCFSEPPASYAGIEMVELMSSAELEAEGQNLKHCVGGYAQRCMEGRCRILSLRSEGKHLSTVEISVDDNGRPLVLQHRSFGNGVPGAACTAAVASLLSDIQAGRIHIRRLDQMPVRGVEYDLSNVSPTDFRRFIRRDLSRLDWAEFSDSIAEFAGKVAPDAFRIVDRDLEALPTFGM